MEDLDAESEQSLEENRGKPVRAFPEVVSTKSSLRYSEHQPQTELHRAGTAVELT